MLLKTSDGSKRHQQHGKGLPQDPDRTDEGPSQDDEIASFAIHKRVKVGLK